MNFRKKSLLAQAKQTKRAENFAFEHLLIFAT